MAPGFASLTPPAIRAQEVRPPSVRREVRLVFRVALHVVFWSGMVIAFQRGFLVSGSEGQLAPDEVAFADLAPADQRLFRRIQEGVLEAENERGATGRWPTVAELGAQEIPPFAPDPIDRAGYVWSDLRDGLLVNYSGVPEAGSGRAAFLVLIQEPPVGQAKDPRAPTDEIHHRLSDGTMLHVSIWTGPPLSSLPRPLAFAPAELGWKRITLARPPS